MDSTPLSHRQPFHEGDYLTDQRRLYRVLQIVPSRLKKRAAILGLRHCPRCAADRHVLVKLERGSTG
jgi:hypothetical protein